LLKKQKENWVSVNITLKLNLPSKSLYNVLISSFDGAENEIIDYVTEGIDIEDIRAALGESISQHYEQSKKSTSQRIDKKESNIQEDGE
jgi:transposase-like protein